MPLYAGGVAPFQPLSAGADIRVQRFADATNAHVRGPTALVYTMVFVWAQYPRPTAQAAEGLGMAPLAASAVVAAMLGVARALIDPPAVPTLVHFQLSVISIAKRECSVVRRGEKGAGTSSHVADGACAIVRSGRDRVQHQL